LAHEWDINERKLRIFNIIADRQTKIRAKKRENSLYFSLLAGNSLAENGSHATPTTAIESLKS
jgi:hypothetical protein